MARFELPSRWDEVDSLLSAALERPAEERLSYVRDRTAGDPDLCRTMEELLEAEAEARSFLEQPIDLSPEIWLLASDEFFAGHRPSEHSGRSPERE